MTTEAAPKKPSSWDKLTPEERDARVAKMQAGRKQRKAEASPSPTSPPMPMGSATPPPPPSDLEAEVVRLKAQIEALTPKPVDVATLPQFETIFECRSPGPDGTQSETLYSPESPRWDELEKLRTPVFGSLITVRLLYDETGKLTGRQQIDGYQAKNPTQARHRWRCFVNEGHFGDGVKIK